MPLLRPTPRWFAVGIVAGLLALAALANGPEQVLRLARGVVRAEPSFAHLPEDAAWSLLRMAGAYVVALAFAWTVGYAAASSPATARVALPLLDIGQSVPVLGFFPAAIYVFITLLGGGRLSLELAAMFLIFTSQAWNLAFGVYEALSTIPPETRAAVDSLGVRGILRVRALLAPACIPSLLYNSILSWSNGWYFLIACEIIVAGPVEYDLPGLGSTLSDALAQGNLALAAGALLTLVGIVLALEFLVWRPLRTWSRRFRYDTASAQEEEQVMLRLPDFGIPALLRPLRAATRAVWSRLPLEGINRVVFAAGRQAIHLARHLRWPLRIAIVVAAGLLVFAVGRALWPPWPPETALVPVALGLSFLRIAVAYVIAVGWIVPTVLWASDHPRALRWLSLAAQVGASIPATAFFPVLVALFVQRFGGMEIVAVALALTGMQWYLLFNLLAGVQRVPGDLRESLRSLGLSRGEIHRRLVIPASMPSLVTGSLVAWGGAWNAVILSEYVVYRERTYQVLGIGALLNRATFGTGSRSLLFLSLAAVVVTVIVFNRLVWQRLYDNVKVRYRLE